MSGGHIMAASDADRAARYLDRCAGGMIPTAISQAWAERTVSLIDWLHRHCPSLSLERAYGAEHRGFDGSDAIDVYWQGLLKDGTRLSRDAAGDSAAAQGAVPAFRPDLRAGPELYEALRDAVETHSNIRINWNAPAQRLRREPTGRVTGVEVASGSETVEYIATRGVVLASGGYEFDTALKRDYLKGTPIYFYGNPGNTGDGIRMAQAVGADLWHMNQMVGRAVGHFDLDGRDLNIPIALVPGSYVLLDRHGSRFTNEWSQANRRHDFYHELLPYDTNDGSYPRNPCFWVFDSERFATPIASSMLGATAVGLYEWSPDNSEEVRRGWISEAESIQDLAVQLGIDSPEAAEESVRAFNFVCSDGYDPLGRPPHSLKPIIGPPFYGVPLYAGGANTSGGPRRSARAEVLGPFGEPIPGLYGAGELGQAIGFLYPAGGCNLSEAMCFGQIAVESALDGS